MGTQGQIISGSIVRGTSAIQCIFILVFFICTSCGHREKEFRKVMKFPENAVVINLSKGQDEIIIGEQKMKIVVFVDSTGCTGCKLQLDAWKYYMEEIREKYNDKLMFMFYLQPRNLDELLFVLESEEFHHPIYIDNNKWFGKINHIYSDEVFLLDENNHILAKGNPLESSNKKSVYAKIINSKLEEE